MKEIPAVSVIIPLYNAEKYIGECLESILAQTFQDFEVIVVDDCSTDSSAAIVESYVPKFNGRLNLIKTKKNSGGPGGPRNLGVRVSRGEYLSIIDNDDALTPTALEELYGLAKKFNADIVHCEKYFSIPEKEWHNEIYRKKIVPACPEYSSVEYVKEPTFLNEDIFTRITLLNKIRLVWNLWSKLIRRNIFIENEIHVINYPYEDMLCTCHLLCCAKKYLLVPNVVNYYRVRETSLSHETQESMEKFRRYIRSLTVGFKYLDTFLNSYDFFRRNVNARLLAEDTLLNGVFVNLELIHPPLSAEDFNKIFRDELQEADSALTSFIFRATWQYRFLFKKSQQRTTQLENFARQAQRRIVELENEVKRLKNLE